MLHSKTLNFTDKDIRTIQRINNFLKYKILRVTLFLKQLQIHNEIRNKNKFYYLQSEVKAFKYIF